MDFTSLLKATFALAIVLGLILALAYGLRKYAPNLLARLSAPRGRKRLEVVETLVLDPTRRVVLVRVDDQERLILLGEGRELDGPQAKTAAKPQADVPVTPAPRPRPVVVPAVKASSATPSPARAAAARAFPQPAPKDPNDDLF